MTDEQDEVIDVPLIIPKRKKESDIPLLLPKKKEDTEQVSTQDSGTTVSQSKNGGQLDPAFSPSTALLGRGTQESSLQGLGLPVMNEDVLKTGATPEKRVTVNTPFGQSSISADAPINELTPAIFSSAIQRGLNQGELADMLAVGRTPTTDDIKRIAELQRSNRQLETQKSDAYKKFNESKGFGEAISAFVSTPTAPLEIITELSLESLSALAKHGATRMAVGAAEGAALGSVIPGLGTATGLGYGLISSMGVSSLNLEYSGKILETLAESGINLEDEQSLKDGFANEELMSEARILALKKGIPVALFDMVSGKIGGKFLPKGSSTVGKKIAAGAKEVAAQSALGGGGEVAGELTAGEELNAPAILGEVFGEVGGGLPDIATGAFIRKAEAGENITGDLLKISKELPKEQRQEVFNETIDISEGIGEVTPEQAVNLKEQFAQTIAADEKIPENVLPEQRVELIPLISEKTKLEEKKSELEASKEKVDDTFHAAIDEEIKQTDKAIKEKKKEVLFILDDKDKSEPIDLPVTEQKESSKEPEVIWNKEDGYIINGKIKGKNPFPLRPDLTRKQVISKLKAEAMSGGVVSDVPYVPNVENQPIASEETETAITEETPMEGTDTGSGVVDVKVKDAFTMAKKLSPETKILVGGLDTKAANYTTKKGIEVSLKDDDGGDVNGEQVQGDFQLDYIGNEKGERGKGLASKELDRILAEADKNDLSISLMVDSEGATTNPVGDRQGNVGLSNKELKDWYKKRGFIFDKDSNYGYRPKKSENVSKYKADTYQAKEGEIKVGENLEGLPSPQDLREAYQQGNLKEGVFYEDGDNAIYTVKNGKLKLVENADYDYRYEKDENGKVNLIEEVKIKQQSQPPEVKVKESVKEEVAPTPKSEAVTPLKDVESKEKEQITEPIEKKKTADNKKEIETAKVTGAIMSPVSTIYKPFKNVVEIDGEIYGYDNRRGGSVDIWDRELQAWQNPPEGVMVKNGKLIVEKPPKEEVSKKQSTESLKPKQDEKEKRKEEGLLSPKEKKQEKIISPKTEKNDNKEKSTDSTTKEAKTEEVGTSEKGGEQVVAPASEKKYTKEAKKVADKIRALKSKPLQLKDENGNPIVISKKGIDENDIIEGIAKLVEAGGRLADAIVEELSKNKWYNDLTDEGRKAVNKQFSDHFSDDEVAQETKIYTNEKAIISHLVDSENISDAARTKLEDNGLKYEPHSHEEARMFATEIVKGVGEDAAVAYAEANRFSGDINSAIFAVSIDRIAAKEIALRAKGEYTKADLLAQKWADYAMRYDEAARSGGRFISQVYDFYKKSPLGIKIKEQKIREKVFTDWFKDKEGDFKEFWDEVVKQPEFESAVKVEAEKITNKQKAKVFADKLRKGKIDKDIMMAGIPFVKEVWNGAIEVAAKIIETGGGAADITAKALDAALKHIKDSKWYESLSDENKSRAENKFSEYYKNSEGEKVKLTDEQKQVNALEKQIEQLEEQIDDISAGRIKEKKSKLEDTEKIKELKDKKKKLQEDLYDAKAKAGLIAAKGLPKTPAKKITKSDQEKIIKKWSDRLRGLPSAKKEQFIRAVVKEVVQKGDLKYGDFKKILADAIGLGKFTEKEAAVIDDYVDAANKVTELGDLAQEKGTPESIRAYDEAVRRSERAATDLANTLNQETNLTSRITSLVSLNTLGFGTLLKNIGYNIAQQAMVRFPKALIGTAFDYTAYGVSLAANKVYGTPIIKPETNVFLAQRGYFKELKSGLKDAWLKVRRGGTQRDYFQQGVQQSRIKPMQSWRDLKAWNFGNGDKFLTTKAVVDKLVQGTIGVPAEVISRGLFFGDTPPRWAAEGAKAEQIARLKLGIKDKNEIELFKKFPLEQAKKHFLSKGLSEEKAQALAEDIQKQLKEAGDDATLTMDNIVVDMINSVKQFGETASQENPTKNAINTLGRVFGVLNVPYLKIPINAAWLAMNLRNPLLPLVQSAWYGYHGVKSNDAAMIRKSKDWLYVAGVGVSLNAVAAWMVANGIITPEADEDDDKKERDLSNEYSRQNSLNMDKLLRGGGETKDGDVNIDLSWFGAMGTLMNVQAQQSQKEMNEQMTAMDKVGFNMTRGGIDGFTSNVFGGTNALINAYSMGGGYVNQLGLQYFNLMANVFEPAMLTQVSRYGFSRQLDVKGDSLGDAISKEIYQRTFGLMGTKPETKLGIFGTPQTKEGGYLGRLAAGMTGAEQIDTDKMGYVIYDLYNKSNNAELVPPAIPKTMSVNGKQQPLNYQQQRELTQLIGQSRLELVSAFLDNKAALYDAETKKWEYIEKMNMNQISSALKAMYDKGGDLGRDKFKAIHPEFQSEKKDNKATQKSRRIKM